MTLWNIIRDWFVVNIWGGMTSTDYFYEGIVGFFSVTNETAEIDGGTISTTSPFIKIANGYLPDIFGGNTSGENVTAYISLGDWLSTTSTIVVLVILCIIFGLMVRWLFRLTSGLLQGR